MTLLQTGMSSSRSGGVDYSPLVLALCIGTIGVINISSAAQVTAPNLYLYQATWLLLGAGVALAIGTWDYRNLEAVAYPIYGLIVVLLILVLVVGRAVLGAKRWLHLGPMSLQPSELMKVAMVFTMARYLAAWDEPDGYTLRDLFQPLNLSRPVGAAALLAVKWQKLGAVSFTIPWVDAHVGGGTLHTLGVLAVLLWLVAAVVRVATGGFGPRTVLAPMDLVLVPAALILVQPDLGTATINVAVAVSMVLFCGVRPGSLVIATVLGAMGSVAAWFTVLKPYQKRRVLTFLDPDSDALGAGYHANQSMIAIGSGGTQGKGFKAGTQTLLSFLPENQTDFAFSVLGEEWGLVGGVVVLLLFFFLLSAGLGIAARSKDRLGTLLCVGVGALIFWHTVINVGMVTGALPVVGVPLPLMSYGGSSVITVMGGVGVWLSVSARRSR